MEFIPSYWNIWKKVQIYRFQYSEKAPFVIQYTGAFSGNNTICCLSQRPPISVICRKNSV